MKLGTGDLQDRAARLGQVLAPAGPADEPDAVVVFLGANEGFPIPVKGGQVDCCGADWTAAYSAE